MAEDCLSISGDDPKITYLGWQTTIEETLPRASGLAQKPVWTLATATDPVKLASCAAIRPDQRATLDEIPFCDGREEPRWDHPVAQPGEGQRIADSASVLMNLPSVIVSLVLFAICLPTMLAGYSRAAATIWDAKAEQNAVAVAAWHAAIVSKGRFAAATRPRKTFLGCYQERT